MLVLIHAAPNYPFPLAYSVLILLVTSYFTLLSLLPLFCHHYFRCHRHFHHTVATNKLLLSKYLSGAVELTTQLLKLINILWIPCVEYINWVILTREDCCDPYTCGSSGNQMPSFQ